MNNPGFVHLNLHTEYSLVDGVVRIKPLMQAVKAAAMPAVAMTDSSNLFALVKFYGAALSAGIKPIIGVDVAVRQEGQPEPGRLLLLCQNETGYRHLTELISNAYQHGQHSGRPMIDMKWLEASGQGLIALSGGLHGDIGRALVNQRQPEAEALLEQWLAIFPERFYLELHRTGREHEERYIASALELAEKYSVPVVASNDVRFIRREDYNAHEIRVCIHDGRTLDDPRRPRRYSDQQYLRDPSEMHALFADIPEALENTVEIAKRCNLKLRIGESFLPDFPVPPEQSLESYFIEQSNLGLEQRLDAIRNANDGNALPAEQVAQYKARLDTELEVITKMGFGGYFLIVADFIRWAKANGVPVGPGRGSGAGSLVAYALEITDLDPIAYDLLFERFLNPERVSLPDFDVDFCMEGRDRVIEYVAEKYGREKVSQIITYGSLAAKAVVRDVGRVLGHPYGFVDSIAKQIPFEIGMTLDKAIEESEELRKAYETEEEVTALLDMARSLEGLSRNAGKHAGGVVIAPSKLTDFTPLYCEQDGQGLVTQLDKDDVEAIGLVKFDFLGLRTLTIIDQALKRINERLQAQGQATIKIENISLQDELTFKLLRDQATTAVFQLESQGMKDLIKRLQPDKFDDIVALVALFRPGPLQSGMVDDFIDRKHGASIDYAHPALEPILSSTYGVILYQEQVMQIAQVLAGYTLGGADLLRRAMGKKKPEEMAKQRSIFIEGATGNNIDEGVATYIFDLMEKFAGYGFNKSHSAAYALLSYQTAWLKAHYPAEFMASVLSADMDNTDKVVRLIDECKKLGLEVIPPDINVSSYTFTADARSQIVYGMGAIKGLGASAIDAIAAERESDGHYTDLFDFCRRINSQKLNKRAHEALIRSGAMDSLKLNRATLAANLPAALKAADQYQRNQSSGQEDIFASVASNTPVELAVLEKPEWDELEKLAAEKETLGLYLTGHPIQRYQQELLQITRKKIIEHIETYEAKKGPSTPESRYMRDIDVLLAGLVINIRSKNTRNGTMAFLVLDDCSARVDVVIRPDDYQQSIANVERDKVLVVEGSLGADDFSGGYRIRAKKIYNLDQARQMYARALEIGVTLQEPMNGFAEKLGDILTAHRSGACPVRLRYKNSRLSACMRFDDAWKVQPSEQLLERLQTLVDRENVRVIY